MSFTASSLLTPRKSVSSDKCRICGSKFTSGRDKHSLFGTKQELHLKLQKATGHAITEADGLPHFVCHSCRGKLLTFASRLIQLEATKTEIAELYAKTLSQLRFKRGVKESVSRHSAAKRVDLTASPSEASLNPNIHERYAYTTRIHRSCTRAIVLS